MLRELAVQNLALIEDVRVELAPGFCAWTGATGAGKSLLLGALGLLLGDRGSTDLLRQGADELRVTGVFSPAADRRPLLEAALGDNLSDDELILGRRLRRDGRGQAYVNDRPVALATLKKLGALLVDIHGQRESHALLDPGYQLELLDAYGGLHVLRRQYQEAAQRCRDLRARRRDAAGRAEQRQRELALLAFEHDELVRAELQPGELPALQAERDRLAHAQALQEFALTSVAQLYEEEGAVIERLGRVQRAAQGWAAVDTRLAEVAQRLASMRAEICDVTRTLQHCADGYEADPARLDVVERRLALLHRLQTKYGRSPDDLCRYRDSLAARAAALRQEEDEQAQAESAWAEAWAAVQAAAAALSRARAQVARQFAAAVQEQLADLGLAEARLTAALTPQPLDPETLPTAGAEALEFQLTANPGEEARPLRKVASGGELARTMLALQSVLADHERVGTVVFDEIDANVGGRLGDVLGQKLAALGQARQVICITHLPQVASYARHQWTIRKEVRRGRTVTSIAPLTAQTDRLEELASMLRGASRGPTTRKEAAAMLAAAAKCW